MTMPSALVAVAKTQQSTFYIDMFQTAFIAR